MLRSKPRHPIRTTLDLADAQQVRSVRRRLGVAEADLARIVSKIGNSLAAIQKEVELEKAGAVESKAATKE
ncbi:DUF3606 domain-containing protein [Bradyrhizobium sp. CCBAU 53415]|uniref:DUF3606 domain-containing protein n=1 Tax=Bradyrhizobium sp. CCBAU 53415 TaxID=1325119 RepID=UPI002305A514|nr:DUF3606 domain-containing protein [Bradyrhizobium sp. CCBAU 53415]MDA9464822.1 hypothetical protein [Bradyrhizobium sp. CCBAU 53415]